MTFNEKIALNYQVRPTGHPLATSPLATPDSVAREYQQRYLMGICEKKLIEQIIRNRFADDRFTEDYQPSRTRQEES